MMTTSKRARPVPDTTTDPAPCLHEGRTDMATTIPTDPTQLPPLPRPQDSRNAAAPFSVPPRLDDGTAAAPPAPLPDEPVAPVATPAPRPPIADSSAITLALSNTADRLQPFVLYPAPLGAVPLPSSVATAPATGPDTPVAAVDAAPATLGRAPDRNAAAQPAPAPGYNASGAPAPAADEQPAAGWQVDERA